jgi:hypothetical protein
MSAAVRERNSKRSVVILIGLAAGNLPIWPSHSASPGALSRFFEYFSFSDICVESENRQNTPFARFDALTGISCMF